jgi:hypothetical protein
MVTTKPLGSIFVSDNVLEPSLFDFEIFSFEVGKLALGLKTYVFQDQHKLNNIMLNSICQGRRTCLG